MAPFRPSNLNKRIYPGNANVIGPTVKSSCIASSTTCTSCVSCIGPVGTPEPVLGCRFTFIGCPCCCHVCTCTCTVCTRTRPSGMYKTSEVYDAVREDRWGPTTSSNTSSVCQCCICLGIANPVANTDMKGFFICKGPEYWYGGCGTDGQVFQWSFCDYTQNVCVGGASSPCSGRAHPWPTGCHGANACWYVAPSCTQAQEAYKSSCPNSTNWCALNSAITQMGSCGWCIPGRSWMPCFGTPRGTNCSYPLRNPGYVCRSYWDSFAAASYWASNREYIHSWGPDTAGSHGPYMFMIDFNNGYEQAWYNSAGNSRYTRAFRVVENGVNTTIGHQ